MIHWWISLGGGVDSRICHPADTYWTVFCSFLLQNWIERPLLFPSVSSQLSVVSSRNIVLLSNSTAKRLSGGDYCALREDLSGQSFSVVVGHSLPAATDNLCCPSWWEMCLWRSAQCLSRPHVLAWFLFASDCLFSSRLVQIISDQQNVLLFLAWRCLHPYSLSFSWCDLGFVEYLLKDVHNSRDVWFSL